LSSGQGVWIRKSNFNAESEISYDEPLKIVFHPKGYLKYCVGIVFFFVGFYFFVLLLWFIMAGKIKQVEGEKSGKFSRI